MHVVRVSAKKIAVDDRYPRCVSKYSEKEHERDTGNPTGIDKLVRYHAFVVLLI